MKYPILSSLFFTYLLSGFPNVCLSEEYKIDDKHTHVLWHINHFGFSNPSGKWMAEGTLQYDKNDPQKSKANITIDVGNIITGLPELDKHLKGKQFFDVEMYPKATFVSDKVTVMDNQITKVDGKLTLHGVTHPVSIHVKQNKIDKNPITEKPTIGFTGEATLNRSDFGIRTLIPGLSDEVKLNIEVEAFEEGK